MGKKLWTVTLEAEVVVVAETREEAVRAAGNAHRDMYASENGRVEE